MEASLVIGRILSWQHVCKAGASPTVLLLSRDLEIPRLSIRGKSDLDTGPHYEGCVNCHLLL